MSFWFDNYKNNIVVKSFFKFDLNDEVIHPSGFKSQNAVAGKSIEFLK